MKIYDISVILGKELPSWPGDSPVNISLSQSLAKGDVCNLSSLSLSSHTGTHVDAPYHFEPDGTTVDVLPLESLIGPAWVVEIKSREAVSREELEALGLQGKERILFKTANSNLWSSAEFSRQYVHLTLAAARCLVQAGIRLVGIDYLSIEKFESADHAVHHQLLRNRVVVLEGLNLSQVPAGKYQLICLPLKLGGGDGAPARAVLMET